MTDVWVVIPTYDERENVPLVLARARAALAACRPRVDATLLVVDDASPDGTGLVADALAAADPCIQVLHRPAKTGLAGAYVDGFSRALAAGADLVMEMDADLSHDPADLPRLIAAAREGADVVLGSRYVRGGATPGWSWHRRLLSRAGGVYAAAVLGVPVADPTGGLKCFRAGALRAIDYGGAASRGFAFQIELTFRAAQAGLRVVEVPITFHERCHGESKMSPAIALEALWRVPALRLQALRPGPHAEAGRATPPTAAA